MIFFSHVFFLIIYCPYHLEFIRKYTKIILCFLSLFSQMFHSLIKDTYAIILPFLSSFFLQEYRTTKNYYKFSIFWGSRISLFYTLSCSISMFLLFISSTLNMQILSPQKFSLLTFYYLHILVWLRKIEKKLIEPFLSAFSFWYFFSISLLSIVDNFFLDTA